MHVLFTEDGEMDKRVFLATWKDIPVQNEVQYELGNVQHNAGLSNNENVHLFVFDLLCLIIIFSKTIRTKTWCLVFIVTCG